MDLMIIIIAVLSLLVCTLASLLYVHWRQVEDDTIVIEEVLGDLEAAQRESDQRLRVIRLLMEREVSGAWLPHVGAEDLAKPRDNG